VPSRAVPQGPGSEPDMGIEGPPVQEPDTRGLSSLPALANGTQEGNEVACPESGNLGLDGRVLRAVFLKHQNVSTM
jgi:hypothetical protein